MLEPWVEWIKRTTGIAEKEARKVGVADWVGEQRKRKWELAGHMSRRDDGRWSTATLEWEPKGKRKVGRPEKRWVDEINVFIEDRDLASEGSWRQLAADRGEWRRWKDYFSEI